MDPSNVGTACQASRLQAFENWCSRGDVQQFWGSAPLAQDICPVCPVCGGSSDNGGSGTASLAIIIPVVVAAVLLLAAVLFVVRKRVVAARQHRRESMPFGYPGATATVPEAEADKA